MRPGKNFKFRLLCKRCNSYQHTKILVRHDDNDGPAYRLICLRERCLNEADDIDEKTGADAT